MGVRSTPGVGSVFFAVLPSSATAPASSLAAAPSAGVSATPEAPTVLVVDDDPAALKLADRTLSRLGYRVICRSSSESALRVALTSRPAAIVTDLVMPAPDGWELIRRLRDQVASEDTPLIVWTVKELTLPEREHLQLSTDTIVVKGDGAAALLEALQKHVPAPNPPGGDHGR